MTYGITDVWTYLIGAIIIVLLPGPNSLYVMSVASSRGIAAGYRGACGIFLGDTILMVLTATGAASLLRAMPVLFTGLKYAGGAYLSWLGFCLLRQSIASWRGKAAPAQQAEALKREGPFRRALVISLMNPKAILFFVSFFIQFVDPHYAHPALTFLILGGIVQGLSALYLSGLIFGGAYLASQFCRQRRFSALATAGVGGLFIGFGVKLACVGLT